MKEFSKLPELAAFKLNKRVGKFTPVVRVYTTKKGGKMFFMDKGGAYYYCSSPYFFWSACMWGYPKMQKFYARICGVN